MHATALEHIMDDTDNQAPCNGTSVLEDDLALSSSTLGMSNKSYSDLLTTNNTFEPESKVVYMSEDAMDCVYTESNDTLKDSEVIDEPPSPDMFGSDTEDAPKSNSVTDNDELDPKEEEIKVSQAEMVVKSDNQLLSRLNEALSGVPPPPSVTISQMDCTDFLRRIKQNSHLFWPSDLDEEKTTTGQAEGKDTVESGQKLVNLGSKNSGQSCSGSTYTFYQQIKSGSRNLMNAFDACDLSSLENSEQQCCDKSNSDNCEKNLLLTRKNFSDCSQSAADGDNSSTLSNIVYSNSTFSLLNDSRTTLSVNEPMTEDKSFMLNYRTVRKSEAAKMEWPEAYAHKSHGIHYNRSTAVEDFEYLSMKLCERYIGAETQSTCNVWFAKQAPGSATKRKMLGRRNVGQSPGRRLSHLARRRKAFSSANLQGLGLAEKRQLILDVKKPLIKKGKSPRGKGVRGKSPRGKSPRSSAKKRAARRLLMEGPSPRKCRVETSKRALFQSPPGDRGAGPSRINAAPVNTSLNPQKIKRALFPTPSKKDEAEKRVTFEDTKKRKSDEDLEGPRHKWPKSLSFDCPRDLEKKPSADNCKIERHSTGGVLTKSETAMRYQKGELTEQHKKKLLWAVAEALRGKGIGISHPQFKQYGSLLARTVKKFMPDLENRNIPRKPGSTSDRMLKFAKQYVLTIVDAKPTNCSSI